MQQIQVENVESEYYCTPLQITIFTPNGCLPSVTYTEFPGLQPTCVYLVDASGSDPETLDELLFADYISERKYTVLLVQPAADSTSSPVAVRIALELNHVAFAF